MLARRGDAEEVAGAAGEGHDLPAPAAAAAAGHVREAAAQAGSGQPPRVRFVTTVLRGGAVVRWCIVHAARERRDRSVPANRVDIVAGIAAEALVQQRRGRCRQGAPAESAAAAAGEATRYCCFQHSSRAAGAATGQVDEELAAGSRRWTAKQARSDASGAALANSVEADPRRPRSDILAARNRSQRVPVRMMSSTADGRVGRPEHSAAVKESNARPPTRLRFQ